MLDECFVFITGRMACDPELKYLGSGIALANFAVAVNDLKKKDDDSVKVSFFDCTAWAKTAEILCEHAHKGDGVVLRGSLRQEKWQAKDGVNRSRVVINVNSVVVVPRSKKAAEGAEPTKSMAPGDVPF